MDTIDVYPTRKPAPVPVLRDHVTVATGKIMPGMFVIALDRPWEGTPFPLQAFLIDEVDQIKILRQLCKHIVIDPRRSTSDSLKELVDLYILPDEELEAEEDEPFVKIRFVDSKRESFAPKTVPTLSLSKLREGFTSTLRELWDPAQDSLANSSRPSNQEQDLGQGAAIAIPRFSQTQIMYAPTSSATPGGAGPSKALRRAIDWDNRSRTPENSAEADERFARFEEFVRGLYPDWSRFTGGLEFFRKLASGWRRKPKRLAQRRKALEVRGAAKKNASVPRTIDLVIYKDRFSVRAEVPRARESFTSVEDALSQMRADFATEASIRVDGLPAAIDSMVESAARNPDALIWVSRVRMQDAMAYTHSIKVASYLLAFGRHLGFPAAELTRLAMVGLLMDVGKLDVDPELLNKREALTDEEFDEVKLHVEKGLARLAGTMDLPSDVRDGIAHHHEWVNGQGYPAGLEGGEISIFGRMAAIVDAYAALTTARPYAQPLSSYEALQVIYSQAGEKYHAPLVEEFVMAIGLFPVGSLVLLSSEEVAVVTAHDKRQRLEPRVLVLTTAFKHALERPYELDLTRKPKDPEGKPIKILRSLPAGVHGIDFRNFYIA